MSAKGGTSFGVNSSRSIDCDTRRKAHLKEVSTDAQLGGCCFASLWRTSSHNSSEEDTTGKHGLSKACSYEMNKDRRFASQKPPAIEETLLFLCWSTPETQTAAVGRSYLLFSKQEVDAGRIPEIVPVDSVSGNEARRTRQVVVRLNRA